MLEFYSLIKLDFYGAVIGDKKLIKSNSIILLLVSLFFIGISCLLLVKACELIGEEKYSFLGIHNLNGLNLPISIISVIIAAAATSVPDTIISIKDAKKGNYNDAISNAIGSNIFDICIALGLPILLYSLIYGPIVMSPEVFTFSISILIVLFILTIITFIVFVIGESMGVLKASILFSMYLFFIIYVVINFVT